MIVKKANDEQWMKKAIELSLKARLIAPPNPWVGCVIVKDNKSIAEGFTSIPGKAHAEINALQSTDEDLSDATVYVTLEPCCHHGKTPPCVDALIARKVKRVVIGTVDPDPIVKGEGIIALRSAGITVDVGIEETAVLLSLEPYLFQRRFKRPYTVCKTAISLDGRTAAKDLTSQWISSKEARADSHYLRACSQAILIGSSTANSDMPALTVRDTEQKPAKPPIRVILDTTGKTKVSYPLFDTKLAPTLIYTSDKCPENKIKEWKIAGAEVIITPLTKEGKIDIPYLLENLASKGVIQLLVEGGRCILTNFVKNGYCEKLVVYVGAVILGSDGLAMFDDWDIPSIDKAPRLKIQHTELFGDTVRVDYLLT